MDFEGRVAVVTGAGSGIGRACATALAARGASVVVADIDEVAGRGTVDAVGAAGGTAELVRVDVTSLDDLSAMLGTARQRLGGIDILVNNAGIVCGEPLWPATDPGLLARQVAVNLTAVVVGTRLAVEPIAARGGGAVLNIASLGALLPLTDEPVYSATKAGVVGSPGPAPR